MGVPVVDAASEAESQCAELVKKKVNSNPKITENEILDFFQRLFSEINLIKD